MHWLELKVHPPLVTLATGVVMLGVSRILPGFSLAWPGRIVVALSLVVVGGAIALAGVAVFRRQGTTIKPTTPGAASSLVSSGVYRYSRNPMYLGLLLALTGLAVYLSNAAAVLFLAAFVAYMTRYQIKPEERALLAKFGPAFAQYMSNVRRWV